MNNFKQGLMVFIILFPVSCTYDYLDVPDIYHTWNIKSLHSVDSAIPSGPPPEGEIKITFKRDNSFDLKLEVNTCTGTFTAYEEDIALAISGCTKICCDTEFSLKLLDMLTRVESYKIEGTRMTIFNDYGFIKLELY